REGFLPRPRPSGPPREGDPSRGRSNGPRPSGAFSPRPRPSGPPREGYAPRGRAGAPPRREGFTPRPRPEGSRPAARRVRDDVPRRGSFTPRPPSGAPRAPYERPRSGPPRHEGPRNERPRDIRPRDDRAPMHDDGGDQTGAVNRSRPVYPQGPGLRRRRDGKPSQRPASWPTPRGEPRPGPGRRA